MLDVAESGSGAGGNPSSLVVRINLLDKPKLALLEA
jgi:hypothetical protein